MTLILAFSIAFAVFAGEIVFTWVLAQDGFCVPEGNSLLKAVIYPLAAVSAALWGGRYFGFESNTFIQCLVCLGVSGILFLVEFFLLKKKLSSLHCIVFLVQSAIAVVLANGFYERSDFNRTVVVYSFVSLLPCAANIALGSLKTKVNKQKCGVIVYIMANLISPAAACAVFTVVMNEVLANLQAA